MSLSRHLLLVASLVLVLACSGVSARIRFNHPLPPSSPSTVAVDAYTPIRIALKQNNIQQLENELYAVSSPESTRYGRHLTADEIGQIIGINDEDFNELTAWLIHHPSIRARQDSLTLHATRDYIDVEVPTTVAFTMVGNAGQRQRQGEAASVGLGGEFSSHPTATKLISFAIFLDSRHNHALRLSDDSVSEFQDWQRLPTLSERRANYALEQMKKNAAKVQHAKKHGLQMPNDSSGTPAAQRAAYGVPADLKCTNPNNTQMVWGTGTYGFTPSDLQQYYSTMGIDASELNKLIVTDAYGQQGGDNWGEGTLDVSLISALAPNVLTFVSNTDTSSGAEEGDGFGPAMLKWMTDLINNSTEKGVPGVISLSLGSLSWDSCNLLCSGVEQLGQNVTYAQCQAYMQQQRQVCMYPDSDGLDRMNVEFMKLGTLGSTVVAATGDGGSHFSFQFFSNDAIGTLLNEVACSANFPTFPSESPYVTGVGGTDWSSNGSGEPVAWAASGSGFSWRYTRPAYQDTAMKGYFGTTQLPPSSAFNQSNRGYPDVAALATNVPVVFSGSVSPTGGTSCAAPEFGAIVSLLNDARLNNGLTTLGFLNPILYGLSAQSSSVYGEIFYDMSTGSSDCDSNGACCNRGTAFDAAVGWDPTTGLGRPKFEGLMKYLKDNQFQKMFQ